MEEEDNSIQIVEVEEDLIDDIPENLIDINDDDGKRFDDSFDELDSPERYFSKSPKKGKGDNDMKLPDESLSTDSAGTLSDIDPNLIPSFLKRDMR